MSPEDVQHVLDRVRARMPVAASTMEAALEYIGERWGTVTELNRRIASLSTGLTSRVEEVKELKEEIEDLKRERPVQSDDEPEPTAQTRICLHCTGWGCVRCVPKP